MPADLRTLSAGGASGAPFDDELGYEPEDSVWRLIFASSRSEAWNARLSKLAPRTTR